MSKRRDKRSSLMDSTGHTEAAAARTPDKKTSSEFSLYETPTQNSSPYTAGKPLKISDVAAMRAHAFPVGGLLSLIKELVDSGKGSDVAKALFKMHQKKGNPREVKGGIADKIPQIVLPLEIEERINSAIREYVIHQTELDPKKSKKSLQALTQSRSVLASGRADGEKGKLASLLSRKETLERELSSLTSESKSPSKKSARKGRRADDEEGIEDDKIKSLSSEIAELNAKITKTEDNLRRITSPDKKVSAIVNETEFASQYPDIYKKMFFEILIKLSIEEIGSRSKTTAKSEAENEELSRALATIRDLEKSLEEFSQSLTIESASIEGSLFGKRTSKETRLKAVVINSPSSLPSARSATAPSVARALGGAGGELESSPDENTKPTQKTKDSKKTKLPRGSSATAPALERVLGEESAATALAGKPLSATAPETPSRDITHIEVSPNSLKHSPPSQKNAGEFIKATQTTHTNTEDASSEEEGEGKGRLENPPKILREPGIAEKLSLLLATKTPAPGAGSEPLSETGGEKYSSDSENEGDFFSGSEVEIPGVSASIQPRSNKAATALARSSTSTKTTRE